MINLDLKQEVLEQEVLKHVDIARQSTKNNFEVMSESYLEIMERLDFITYMIIRNKKK